MVGSFGLSPKRKRSRNNQPPDGKLESCDHLKGENTPWVAKSFPQDFGAEWKRATAQSHAGVEDGMESEVPTQLSPQTHDPKL